MNSLVDTLGDYGANPEAIRWLDHDDPSLLPYATILAARANASGHADSDFSALVAVYEWQDTPFMFLVDGDSVGDEAHFQRLRRKLALRGDAPYLGLVRPGVLAVHSLSLDRKRQRDTLVPLKSAKSFRRLTIPTLAQRRPGAAHNRRVWISDVVLTLLRDSIQALAVDAPTEDAISLAGRALFLRFLGDRHLLPSTLLPEGTDAGTLFADAASTLRTSRWLDETFRGDILPFSPLVVEKLSPAAFGALVDIMRRAPKGQLYLGWQRKWDYLDFAHIPVGVLSQAYEQYMRDHKPAKQREEGGFYTPRAIAELMVKVAFLALRADGKGHSARVLDPAVGAGVFLLIAFRHLVAERWTHTTLRPDTAVLRKILYDQLVGFDVNEEALRFAALGLYLMSIELDPHPEPVTKLRFDYNLRDRVLIKVTSDARQDRETSHIPEAVRSAGSLGRGISSEHADSYDLVLGNPPWTTGTKLPCWREVEETVRGIARTRLSPKEPPHSLLPNECLDLPFVWRAMEWAHPEGQIAFALHARLLFQQGDGMPEARLALFQALDVTGLLNGAELRNSKVWPEIEAPFCLLFARNRRPSASSAFRFLSPHLEDSLSGAGILRLDASSAELLTTSELAIRPELFKILFRGTRLDLEVFERMNAANTKLFEDYWDSLFEEDTAQPDKQPKRHGSGYQKLRASSRIRKKDGDGLPGVSAEYLSKLEFPEMTHGAMRTVHIARSRLRSFAQKRIHDPRPSSIFQGPLLIIHQSPPARTLRIRTGATSDGTIFSETYYGYSANSRSDGVLLTRYLALVLGSRPALWCALITSGKFGFEREVIEKSTIDRMPVIPLKDLDAKSKARINELFTAVAKNGSDASWQNVDRWVAELYGLRQEDLDIIDDTLRYSLPFSTMIKDAQTRPAEVSAFCDELASELRLWAEGDYNDVRVAEVKLTSDAPWMIVWVHSTGPRHSKRGDSPSLDDLGPILLAADLLGATQMTRRVGEPGEGLWIARLAQARYWTRSQARLVARRIIWNDLDALFGRH